MAAGGSNRIRIHAKDTGIRVQLVKLIFNKLRTRADERKHTAAVGAAAVNSARIAAVMAHKALICAVICQRNAAIRAFIDVSAVAAADELICSAAVYEQYALLAAGEVIFKLGAQAGAELAAVSGLELLFHIDYFDRGQLHRVVSLVQLEKLILPGLSRIAAFDIRSCGAEQKQ